MNRIRKGDQVLVITGKNKGQRGDVLRVDGDRVFVSMNLLFGVPREARWCTSARLAAFVGKVTTESSERSLHGERETIGNNAQEERTRRRSHRRPSATLVRRAALPY